MHTNEVLHTLLLAMEHLSYRPSRYAVAESHKTPDGEYIPLSEWHHMEAVRLIAQVRQQLAEEDAALSAVGVWHEGAMRRDEV